jgi:putative heme-binding domain-containing protein
LVEKLTDACAEVREGTLRLAENRGDHNVLNVAYSLVEDPDPKVILQLAFSLGQWSDPEAGRLLSRIAERYPDDPFVQAAVMSSSLRHANSFAIHILDRNPKTLAAYREPLLRQSIAISDDATLSVVLDHAIQVAETSGDATTLDAILLDLQRLGVDIYELSGRTTDQGLVSAGRRLAQWAETAKRRSEDTSLPSASRITACIPLSRLSANRDQAVSMLATWLNPTIDPALQLQIVRALAQSGHARVPQLLAQTLPQLTPELSGAAIDAWLAREAWIEDLVARMERAEIDWKLLQPVQLARLRQHPLATLAERFRALESLGGEATREEVLARYLDATHSQGDAARGQKVYERACASCHRRGSNFLGEVGPNLASVVSHTKEKLLRNILIPSADIQPGFHAFTCLLEEGEVIAGVLASETANSIAIKQANGEVRSIPREEIQQLRNSNRSLMPDGLEATIQVEEMRDLIEYLQQPIANP